MSQVHFVVLPPRATGSILVGSPQVLAQSEMLTCPISTQAPGQKTPDAGWPKEVVDATPTKPKAIRPYYLRALGSNFLY